MACTCKRDIEEKLRAKGYDQARLMTGAFFCEEGEPALKWASTTDAHYVNGKTKGGKDRVKKMPLTHSYCPFCGKKYD